MQHLLDAVAIQMGNPATKLALMAIADDASDKTNMSFPGMEKVCEWAEVGPRRASQIITDLVDRGYIERVSRAYRGRRAVYLVTLPPRPREPVDNSQIKGEAQFHQSGERWKSEPTKGEAQFHPLRITSPKEQQQSSAEAHQSLGKTSQPTTTDHSLAPADHGLRALLDRIFTGRRRHGIIPDLDLERLVVDTRTMWGRETVAAPGFIEALDDFALEILRRGSRRRITNPTAYVLAAFTAEPIVWRAAMDDRLGLHPEPRKEAHHDNNTPAWHR
jgi:hypothetical protein